MVPGDSDGTADPYRVVIKRSARRTNAAAAEWVAQEGPVRLFESKAAAREWADRITAESGRAVRIQDAVPHDRADVDGYLVVDPVERRQSMEPNAAADTTERSLAAFEDADTEETNGEYVQTQF